MQEKQPDLPPLSDSQVAMERDDNHERNDVVSNMHTLLRCFSGTMWIQFVKVMTSTVEGALNSSEPAKLTELLVSSGVKHEMKTPTTEKATTATTLQP
ncbi:hypothetical protein ACFX10_035453 [Malus domestica]